jgi:hypothetical protein
MGAKGVQAKASSLFVPFRALGLVTEGVPFVTQRRGREIFITLSVGTSWQVCVRCRVGSMDKCMQCVCGLECGDACI